jgi:K+-transporting ATPase KdpF subunit
VLPLATLGAADVFGLIVSILIIVYLFYALVRGERF